MSEVKIEPFFHIANQPLVGVSGAGITVGP